MEHSMFLRLVVIASNNSLMVSLNKQTASDDGNDVAALKLIVTLLTPDTFKPMKQLT